jgi:glycosyltransferase involved in cell wall biosynthesis
VKVSVILPTYNRARLVAGTIDSILKQTFRDFELIVIDDYSKDATEKVIKAYADERIRYFRHDSGRLVAVNRNYGMAQACGEYIAFCDDDDLWLPGKLEKQLQEFEKDGSLSMVCANGVFFNDTGDLGLVKDKFWKNPITFKSILRYSPIITSSVIVKKDVIDDVGVMNTDPLFYAGEDYELWLRISRKYKIRYLYIPLVKLRKHSHSIHLQLEGIASIKHLRQMYRWFLKMHFINRGLYWRLFLWTVAIEFLVRTRTVKLASRLRRLLLKIKSGLKRLIR